MGQKLPKADFFFSKYTDSQLLYAAQNIHNKMDGNTNFPTPPIDMEAFQTYIDAFQLASVAAIKGSKAQTEAKSDIKTQLKYRLRVLGQYVTYTATGGNVVVQRYDNAKTIILSSGFELAKTPLPVGNNGGIKLPIVKEAISKESGTLHILLKQYTKFKKGTKVWQVKLRTAAHGVTPAGEWQSEIFTSGNIDIVGLTTGLTYDWQVAAIGGKNTKKNAENPINFTNIQQVVII